jgi:hypothetical protein
MMRKGKISSRRSSLVNGLVFCVFPEEVGGVQDVRVEVDCGAEEKGAAHELGNVAPLELHVAVLVKEKRVCIVRREIMGK